MKLNNLALLLSTAATLAVSTFAHAEFEDVPCGAILSVGEVRSIVTPQRQAGDDPSFIGSPNFPMYGIVLMNASFKASDAVVTGKNLILPNLAKSPEEAARFQSFFQGIFQGTLPTAYPLQSDLTAQGYTASLTGGSVQTFTVGKFQGYLAQFHLSQFTRNLQTDGDTMVFLVTGLQLSLDVDYSKVDPLPGETTETHIKRNEIVQLSSKM